VSVVNAVKAAIFARLDGDATMDSLATGGVHERTAPQGTACPYVIFHKQTGTPRYALGNNYAFTEDLYLIKGVTDEPSSKVAGQIAERVDALFDRYALSVTGSTVLVCRRELDVDYDEHTDGRVYKHVGAIYRIGVQ
jgi:hypothetical protein